MKKRICVPVALGLLCLLAGCKSGDYKTAAEFETAGDYAEALAMFETLPAYKDADARAESCREQIRIMDAYAEACADMEKGDFESALPLLEEIGDYEDAAERAENCRVMIPLAEDYRSVREPLDEDAAALNTLIDEAQELILAKQTPLDLNCIDYLEMSIAEGKAARVELGDMPLTEDEIRDETEMLRGIDYSPVLRDLTQKKTDLETSIRKYELVSAPTEDYVIAGLLKVPEIGTIAAVTEENDPNGKLNKAGGYTAQVFFASDLVPDPYGFFTGDVIEDGTAGGGSIEVYATPEDAERRNEYFSGFDGGILSNGSHRVCGTVVIRISDELSASQQRELEGKIVDALTELEDDHSTQAQQSNVIESFMAYLESEGYAFEITDKAPELIGADEGCGLRFENGDTMELYRFDTESDAYHSVEETGQVVIEMFGAAFDADIVRDGLVAVVNSEENAELYTGLFDAWFELVPTKTV